MIDENQAGTEEQDQALAGIREAVWEVTVDDEGEHDGLGIRGDGMIYTRDPDNVTSVTWSISSDAVMTEYDDLDEYENIDQALYNKRMKAAMIMLHMKCQKQYPNAVDQIVISDGGIGNQYAHVSPRANAKHGAIYEPFMDELIEWENEVCAFAIGIFPPT